MKKSFKSLSRIQKFNIDEQRKILSQYISEEDKLEERLKKLNEEYEQEKEAANNTQSVKVLSDFAHYLKAYLKKREDLEAQLQAIRDKIEQVKDLIADLFKEQKSYDIIDESRKKAELKEEADNEQKMLDEIGTNNYIKRNKK